MKTFTGIAASPGYAVGPIFPIRRKNIIPNRRSIAADEVSGEVAKFGDAVDRARCELQELSERLLAELGAEEADIMTSQLLMLEDEMVWDTTLAAIKNDGLNAEAAFARSVAAVAARFLEMEDETFRERVNDVRDMEQRVLRNFSADSPDKFEGPSAPSIISAVNLTPSDTAALGKQNVLGFIMDEGGNTSHVAILARSIGVPAIVGLKGQAVAQPTDQIVALDGTDGRLIITPDEETTEHFQLLTRQQIVINEKLAYLKDLPAVTPDGHRVRMMANIELPVEVDEAIARGAEGIGLLRTEYLFFQHRTIPTEDDQVRMYSEIVRRMGDRPVIFRTLDVGGDKVSDYLGAKIGRASCRERV